MQKSISRLLLLIFAASLIIPVVHGMDKKDGVLNYFSDSSDDSSDYNSDSDNEVSDTEWDDFVLKTGETEEPEWDNYTKESTPTNLWNPKTQVSKIPKELISEIVCFFSYPAITEKGSINGSEPYYLLNLRRFARSLLNIMLVDKTTFSIGVEEYLKTYILGPDKKLINLFERKYFGLAPLTLTCLYQSINTKKTDPKIINNSFRKSKPLDLQEIPSLEKLQLFTILSTNSNAPKQLIKQLERDIQTTIIQNPSTQMLKARLIECIRFDCPEILQFICFTYKTKKNIIAVGLEEAGVMKYTSSFKVISKHVTTEDDLSKALYYSSFFKDNQIVIFLLKQNKELLLQLSKNRPLWKEELLKSISRIHGSKKANIFKDLLEESL